MNVVVSNQAVLEKNSPLLLTFLFFFFFLTCNQPVFLVRKGFSCQPAVGWERGTAGRGQWGRGKPPRQSISASRKVAQDSKWMWSENHLVLEVRGRVPRAPWEKWTSSGVF